MPVSSMKMRVTGSVNFFGVQEAAAVHAQHVPDLAHHAP
jgi:hypothetical protein